MKNLSLKFIFFICILLFNNYIIYESSSNKIDNSNNISITDLLNTNIHSIFSPIKIENNTDFFHYGFLGNGTIDNPYIIENLSIINNTCDLISINNTTVFFTIRNCYLDCINNNFSGIYLENVINASLSNNTIINAHIGISLKNSTNNNISTNNINDCSYRGLFLDKSDRNQLTENEIKDNNIGIVLRFSNNNTIDKNLIINGRIGIYIEYTSKYNNITNNIIEFFTNYGISLYNGCKNNNIYNNNITNCEYGIFSDFCHDNNISYNLIENNQVGIQLINFCSQMRINNNIIRNNSLLGLQIGFIDKKEGVTYCLITRNSFIDNNIEYSQAADYDTYNTFIFNYWSDWISPDNDNDGIVDIPYIIDGNNNNSDFFPLVSDNKNVSTHYLNKPMIPIPIINLNQLDFIRIKWTPAVDSFGFAVKYSLYYSNNQGENWINMILNTEKFDYIWNATSFDAGCYQLKVIAESDGGLVTEGITDGFPLKMDQTLSFPEFLSPDFNKTLSGNVTIQWSPAIDNCYYLITYNLSYSVDGGNMWILLASNLNTTFFEWDTSTVSSGVNYRLKIVAISFSGLISTTILDQSFTINNDELYLFIKSFPFIELLFITIILFELFFLNFLIRFIKIKTKVTNK